MAQFVEYPYRWSWRNYLGGNTYTTVYSAFPAVAYTGPIRNLQAVAEVIPAGTDAPVTMPVSQSFFVDEET